MIKVAKPTEKNTRAVTQTGELLSFVQMAVFGQTGNDILAAAAFEQRWLTEVRGGRCESDVEEGMEFDFRHRRLAGLWLSGRFKTFLAGDQTTSKSVAPNLH